MGGPGAGLKLGLRGSHEARQAALASIRSVPGGWQVRIGGAVRGKFAVFTTRDRAESAVHAHYNAAMMAAIRKERQ